MMSNKYRSLSLTLGSIQMYIVELCILAQRWIALFLYTECYFWMMIVKHILCELQNNAINITIPVHSVGFLGFSRRHLVSFRMTL